MHLVSWMAQMIVKCNIFSVFCHRRVPVPDPGRAGPSPQHPQRRANHPGDQGRTVQTSRLWDFAKFHSVRRRSLLGPSPCQKWLVLHTSAFTLKILWLH